MQERQIDTTCVACPIIICCTLCLAQATSECVRLLSGFLLNVVLVNQLNKSDVVKVGEKGFQVTVTNGMPKVYYPATSAGMLAGRTSAGE